MNTHAPLLYVLEVLVAIAAGSLIVALVLRCRWEVRTCRIASTAFAAAALGFGGLIVAVFCAEMLSLPFSS